jgi:hypothetical protein
MASISVAAVGDKQFQKARELAAANRAPVVVANGCTYLIPSSSRDERDHKVQLDDPEQPGAVSCTCESGIRDRACWAMARALDVSRVLRDNHVYVSRGAVVSRDAIAESASAFEACPRASCGAGGELELIWGGGPRAGALYLA